MRRTRKERVFDVISYVAIFGVFEFARTLPEAFYPVLSRIKGTIFYYLFPALRIRIEKNLRICFGDEITPQQRGFLAKRIISETLLNLLELEFWFMTDRFTVKKTDDYVSVEGLDILEKLRKEKKPIIAVGSHLGNFAIMMVYLMWKGFPLTWIARDSNNIHVADFFERIRKNRNIYTIHKQNVREELSAALGWLRKKTSFACSLTSTQGKAWKLNFSGRRFLRLQVQKHCRGDSTAAWSGFLYTARTA